MEKKVERPKMKLNAYELQKRNDSCFYLVREGAFFRMYNDAARVITHVKGFKLMESRNPLHEEGTVIAGFPIDFAEKVIEDVCKAFPLELEKQTTDMIVFRMKEAFSIPEVNVTESVYANGLTNTTMNKILNLDMEKTTPMQAFGFLVKLKEECKKVMNY
ncbi:MAG: hypothetical protein KBT34_10785 [Prevotella sp.]|nr:hypothetical protein [Candidatus Prevotella equi]